jgi:tetratricopeptide (TPR) repeat protein
MNPVHRRRFLAAVGVSVGAAVGAALLWGQAFGGPSRVAPYRFRLLSTAAPEAELAVLRERLEKTPDSALDLAALASVQLRLRRYDDAEKSARRSLELLPVYNGGAKLALAGVLQARHDFAGAARLAEDVLREQPRDPAAADLRITLSLALGRVDEAVRRADDLADRLPTTGPLTQRALALEAAGRDGEALHDYERAIALEDVGEADRSSRARAMLARFHLRRGRVGLARDLLVEAVRIHSHNAAALALLGDVELLRGARDEAVRRYEEAFHASGGDPAYVVKVARAKKDAALLARAESTLRDRVAKGPGGHRRTLAELLLLDRGAAGEALGLLLEEAETRRDAETLGLLSEALLRSGRARDARAVVREALATGVRSAPLYARAASVERQLGNAARAELYDRLAREAGAP